MQPKGKTWHFPYPNGAQSQPVDGKAPVWATIRIVGPQVRKIDRNAQILTLFAGR